MHDRMLERLWRDAPPARDRFGAEHLAGLPAPARDYLAHAIAPGTPLAHAVRLRMRGTIRIGRWFPFRAEQVICDGGEMVWHAAVSMYGLPVRGYDRLLAGEGAMRWSVLGLLPFLRAAGPDVSRSAAGRCAAELIWLPSALLASRWQADGGTDATLQHAVAGEEISLHLTLGAGGTLERVVFDRWGDPEGDGFRYRRFGALASAERSFGGYTIPTRLRAGWFPEHGGFAGHGEFFDVTIEEARFR